jgi:hypothetical protein
LAARPLRAVGRFFTCMLGGIECVDWWEVRGEAGGHLYSHLPGRSPAVATPQVINMPAGRTPCLSDILAHCLEAIQYCICCVSIVCRFTVSIVGRLYHTTWSPKASVCANRDFQITPNGPCLLTQSAAAAAAAGGAVSCDDVLQSLQLG